MVKGSVSAQARFRAMKSPVLRNQGKNAKKNGGIFSNEKNISNLSKVTEEIQGVERIC